MCAIFFSYSSVKSFTFLNEYVLDEVNVQLTMTEVSCVSIPIWHFSLCVSCVVNKNSAMRITGYQEIRNCLGIEAVVEQDHNNNASTPKFRLRHIGN